VVGVQKKLPNDTRDLRSLLRDVSPETIVNTMTNIIKEVL